MTTLEKFNKFHAENPEVYLLFEQQALRAIDCGHKKIGSKAIIEYLRWKLNFVNKQGNKPYKIDNNFTPYYSRLFAEKHPNYNNYFVYKSLKS